ncbi:MAG: response regulator [Candidatus Omnitrophota bacterium]
MQKQRLLVCDDETGIQESLNLILSDNFDLLFLHDGEKIIQQLENNPDIKAVLLDIKIPKKNGIEILKEIKSFNKELPVIMITGYQSIETAHEASKLGAFDYITKPFDSKTVLETVRKAI